MKVCIEFIIKFVKIMRSVLCSYFLRLSFLYIQKDHINPKYILKANNTVIFYIIKGKKNHSSFRFQHPQHGKEGEIEAEGVCEPWFSC